MAGPTADPRASLEAVVRGRVQGVGFRYFVLDRAVQLGLVGWVANEPDGSVRCFAEGPRADLEILLGELGQGPLGGRVDDVQANWGPPGGRFDQFTVRSGWHSGD